jgi:hypothetical protein
VSGHNVNNNSSARVFGGYAMQLYPKSASLFFISAVRFVSFLFVSF